MTRLISFAGVVFATVLALGTVASAGEPNPRPVLNVQPGVTAWSLAGSAIGLPGYPVLQMESVQKDLGLTPEQKEKLKDIAKKNAESMKESRFDWTKFRDMKPEEQRKAQQEMADRYARQAEETRKQVEQVLTPKQVEQLKDIEFRQRATSMLYTPQVLQDIRLTEEQKQQMQKIREETQNKMSQLQHESQEKTLGVLTPEQMKKLKELSDKGVLGSRRPQLERTDRPTSK